MLHLSQSLRQKCHINRNDEGDCFVGIKFDDMVPQICFPLGYNLPEEDSALRREILILLKVLEKYTEEKPLPQDNITAKSVASLPISVCLGIIRDFAERGGYYTEREYKYKTDIHGKINWPKTIKRILPLPSGDGGLAYTKYVVRKSPPAEKNLITQIHKYCVYECFCFLGWIFTSYIPEKPSIRFNKLLFLATLTSKLNIINNDRDKKLMRLLKMFVEKKDFDAKTSFTGYGTERFEYVWEKLIDVVFGLKNKQDYFPRTQWNLRFGKNKSNAALEPDSIMNYNGKFYILDAKYYRYGLTGYAFDLPQSSSINKQITYGEYVAKNLFSQSPPDEVPVFNAFILPFDSQNNIFNTTSVMENIGEATAQWKENTEYKYERIQGILLDTKYLIHSAIHYEKQAVYELANVIENAFFTQNSSGGVHE